MGAPSRKRAIRLAKCIYGDRVLVISRLLRVLSATGALFSLVLCATLFILWISNSVPRRVSAWSWNRRSLHVAISHGTFWVTSAGDWSSSNSARHAATVLGGAQPLTIKPNANRAAQELEAARDGARRIAMLYHRKLGDSHPDTLRLERKVAELNAALDGLAQNVVTETAPVDQRIVGITIQRGSVRLPLRRSPDGGIYYEYPPVPFLSVGVPCWMLLVLSIFAPATFVYGRVRHRRLSARRIRLGLCLHCGYDLRGGHNECPECGAKLNVQTPQENRTDSEDFRPSQYVAKQ